MIAETLQLWMRKIVRIHNVGFLVGAGLSDGWEAIWARCCLKSKDLPALFVNHNFGVPLLDYKYLDQLGLNWVGDVRLLAMSREFGK